MNIQPASASTPASSDPAEEKTPASAAAASTDASSFIWRPASSLSQLQLLRRQLRTSGDPLAPLFAERLDQLEQALRDGKIDPEAHADSAHALLEAAGMAYCGEDFDHAVFAAAGFNVAPLAGVAPRPGAADQDDERPHYRAFSLQCGPHHGELRLAGAEAEGPFNTRPPRNASFLFEQIGQDLGLQVDAKKGIWANLQLVLRRNLRVRDNFFLRFKQLNERGQERAGHTSGWLPTSEATLAEQDGDDVDSGIFRPEPVSRGAAAAALGALVAPARSIAPPDGTSGER